MKVSGPGSGAPKRVQNGTRVQVSVFQLFVSVVWIFFDCICQSILHLCMRLVWFKCESQSFAAPVRLLPNVLWLLRPQVRTPKWRSKQNAKNLLNQLHAAFHPNSKEHTIVSVERINESTGCGYATAIWRREIRSQVIVRWSQAQETKSMNSEKTKGVLVSHVSPNISRHIKAHGKAICWSQWLLCLCGVPKLGGIVSWHNMETCLFHPFPRFFSSMRKFGKTVVHTLP